MYLYWHYVFVFAALCICICIMYLHCEFVFALCVFVCAIGISDKDWVECQLIPTRICPEFQPPTHHLLLDIIILVNSKLGHATPKFWHCQDFESAWYCTSPFILYWSPNCNNSNFSIMTETSKTNLTCHSQNTGCFFHWYPPKKLKYGKPRLGESTLT